MEAEHYVASRTRLRVGVIGLGRIWEARHKPSLLRLQNRFQITALYDQVSRRAEMEAAQLGCAAVGGITPLIEREDVDVVYLLGPQWFGLYPIQIACSCQKPVYCALPLAGDLDELEWLAALVESSQTPFMPELARRFYPASIRLRELLATTLGPPRLILGQTRLLDFDRYSQPGPTSQTTPAPLLIDPGSYLLDWCGFLFQSEPVRLQGFQTVVGFNEEQAPSEPDFESFVAEYPNGAAAHIAFSRYNQLQWREVSRFFPPPGFQVYSERGAAWLELPERIQWTDQKGTHEETLPLEPTVGDVMNEQFYRLVQGDASLAPSIHDALQVARRIRDLRQSQQEGRMILRPPRPQAF